MVCYILERKLNTIAAGAGDKKRNDNTQAVSLLIDWLDLIRWLKQQFGRLSDT